MVPSWLILSVCLISIILIYMFSSNQSPSAGAFYHIFYFWPSVICSRTVPNTERDAHNIRKWDLYGSHANITHFYYLFGTKFLSKKTPHCVLDFLCPIFYIIFICSLSCSSNPRNICVVSVGDFLLFIVFSTLYVPSMTTGRNHSYWPSQPSSALCFICFPTLCIICEEKSK